MSGDDDDGDLFRREMASLNVNRRSAATSVVRRRQHDHRFDEPANDDSGVLTDKTSQGDYVEFARGGLQKKVMRKLKRGDYEATDDLDLHGLTTAEAEPRLNNFLRAAVGGGHSAVLIIHGKGLHSGGQRGVLKRFTHDLLKRHRAVKAFCSAQPKDGGTGAVYVLLRR